MFELKTTTEAELTAFVGRTQKSGPDDVPAVSFRLRITDVENALLDVFSKTLRPAIYMAAPGQEDLPGVEPSTPLLRSKDVTHLAPEFRYEGWKVSVARGMNDDALQMQQAKVDDFKFDFYEGGRFDYDFRVSTADLDEAGAGMLWGRQKRKVFVRIVAPELPAPGATEATGAAIDGTKGHPGAAAAQETAEDLFAAGEGFDEEEDEGAAPDLETRLDSALAAADQQPADLDRGENWPFPSAASNGIDTDDARSQEQQREIEAGMRASLATAGVKPKRGARGKAAAVGALE